MKQLTDNALQVLADHAESEGSGACAMDGVTLGALIAELRALRLSAEEREALSWLRSYGGTALRFMEGQSDKAMDTMGRALAVLTRLTTTGRG